MNCQFLITFFTLLQIILAIPIPVAAPDAATVTTTIPVAEVIISNGFTTTIQLTTLAVPTTTYPNLVGKINVAGQTLTSTVSSTPAPSTYVSTDSNGIAHVWITLAKTVLVDENGVPFTTETQQQTATNLVNNNNVQVVATNANLVNNGNVQATQTTETLTQATDVSTKVETTSSTSNANKNIQNAQSTAVPDQSSSLDTTLSDFATTVSSGEVYYSVLSQALVSLENVAPTVAVTTTTLANTADAQTTSTGALSLVSSDSKLLIATLTEGLPKDKNVAMTMVNPATVSVTNTQVITTPVIITTSSSTTSTTTSSTSSSTATSSTDNSSSTEPLSSGTSSSSDSSSSSSSETSSSSGTSSSSETSSSSTTSSASATPSIDASKYLTKTPHSIVYSPYSNDGTCKNYQTVLADLTLIQSKGIQEIRVYGNDCNYMTTVLTVSKILGLKVNQGFWISSAGADSIDTAVDDLITYITSGAASYSWEIFSYFTIGNEAIIANYCTVSELISKIAEVKSKLQNAGYTGQITTSEPPVTFENNPELCTQSEIDFVGVNPHSYFDPYSAASDAGVFVAGQIGIVKQYCGDKQIVVTETGYPNAGIQNGLNIPSADNQRIAVQSILDVVGVDVTILTTFEDLWKNPGPYGIEQNFGIIQLLP
jgi:exo-beta-1,3-glucanase (GH17 family)